MSSADPKEIEKFSKLAKAWWDTNGELKTLHDINPARLQYIQKQKKLDNQKLLDVGCGGGILAESLDQAGAKVTAIDMDKQAIAAAKTHQQESQSQVDYQYYDVTHLATEQAEIYDVITCMEMLEHVPEPAAIIKACAQLLKPQGTLFLSTLNRTPKAYGLAVIGAEYVLAGDISSPLSVAGLQDQSWISVFVKYLEVGFTHIVPKGLDHIFFVIGLFLLSTRLRTLLWQVTAFTIARTITLALGMTGIVQLSSAVVEPLISISIIYVAVENIVTDKLHRYSQPPPG